MNTDYVDYATVSKEGTCVMCIDIINYKGGTIHAVCEEKNVIIYVCIFEGEYRTLKYRHTDECRHLNLRTGR